MLRLYRAAASSLGEIISAVEFMDGKVVGMVLQTHRVADPLSAPWPFYVLIETSGRWHSLSVHRTPVPPHPPSHPAAVCVLQCGGTRQ